MKKLKSIISYLLVVNAINIYSQERYTILTPTPDNKLRPMTTERPSKMDSPYSLDAGRIQIETNLYGYIQNDDCISGVCTDTRQHDLGGSTNLRIGVTDNIDIQFIGNLYQHLTIKNTTIGTKNIHQGFGDSTVRLKISAVGNTPSDYFSFAILPYIKLPTNQDNLGNNKIEGGLGLPFNFALSNSWNISGMTQFNFISNQDGSSYDPAYANAIMISKGLTYKLSTYGEFYTYKADQSRAEWENTLDFGAVYLINDYISVDANIQFGVTDAADDLNFFIGTAYRF